MQMIEKNYSKIISVIRIALGEDEKGKYSHRNYLGGIVKLGLKREKVGDIIVYEKGADIITVEDFVDILKQQLPSLTRFENSNITIEEIQNLPESFSQDNCLSYTYIWVLTSAKPTGRSISLNMRRFPDITLRQK